MSKKSLAKLAAAGIYGTDISDLFRISLDRFLSHLLRRYYGDSAEYV